MWLTAMTMHIHAVSLLHNEKLKITFTPSYSHKNLQVLFLVNVYVNKYGHDDNHMLQPSHIHSV